MFYPVITRFNYKINSLLPIIIHYLWLVGSFSVFFTKSPKSYYIIILLGFIKSPLWAKTEGTVIACMP